MGPSTRSASAAAFSTCAASETSACRSSPSPPASSTSRRRPASPADAPVTSTTRRACFLLMPPSYQTPRFLPPTPLSRSHDRINKGARHKVNFLPKKLIPCLAPLLTSFGELGHDGEEEVEFLVV